MRTHKVYAISFDETDKLVAAESGLCLVCGKVCPGIGVNALGRHCDRCGVPTIFGILQALSMGWINVTYKN